MKDFPETFRAKNKDSFSSLHYERSKAYLRRDIYEHVLRHNEGVYFELDRFNKERVGDMKKTQKMVKEIMGELTIFGWKSKLGYGDTGLFIYSDKEPGVLASMGMTIEPIDD